MTALAAESQVTALALWGGNHCPLLRQSVPCLSRQRRYALARRVQPILRGGSTCRSIPVQHRAFQRIRLQQQLDQRQLTGFACFGSGDDSVESRDPPDPASASARPGIPVLLFVARPPTLQRIQHKQRMDRQRAARAWLALDAATARQSPLGPNADPASASVALATASAAAKPWVLARRRRRTP